MANSSSFRFLFCILLVSLLMVSCRQETFSDTSVSENEVALTFSCDPMQKYNVPTRSSDAKDEEEKRINQLYIFFFTQDGQYLTGTYLTGYKDAAGAIDQGGYLAPGKGTSLVKIDKNGFTEKAEAKKAIVYAVANVEASLFKDLDENGRPQRLQDIIDGSGGSIPSPLGALKSIVYKPSTLIFTTLPEDLGMPMVGDATLDLTGETPVEEQDRIIDMQALMARIDVSLQLNSDISDSNLPSLLLTTWTAKNLPLQGAFTASDTTTPLSEDTKTEKSIRSTQYIYNRQGEISFSFYMFENRQQPTGEPNYPADIEDYQKQRYKPTIANENAACVVLNTQYTTYNNATYTVSYTIYLGSDHTDNFEIFRNHQYKNNIVIKGLIAQDLEAGEFTFDTRVNVEEQNNKYYISILRERNHDAHFCVTPMDVYMFAPKDKQPSMKVKFQKETDLGKDGKPWIRMEVVDHEVMRTGMPQDDDHLGYLSTDLDPETGMPYGEYHAGNGKRKYFTKNLVTETLAEIGKEVTVDDSRDRIYFYVDENLSDSQDRTAIVELNYYEGEELAGSRTLELTQTHFLKVQVYDRTDEDKPDYGKPYDDNNDYDGEDGVIYMEQYEEYLEHYDPLDTYNAGTIYEGLPWGLWGEPVSSPRNWLEGLYYTGEIVEEAGQTVLTLNTNPRSAAEYCYNRNKREEDGSVYHKRTYWGPFPMGYETNRKYFLPGIRQMEDALTQYSGTFGEFKDNYYWSSAAGEKYEGGGLSTNTERARATKVNNDGTYVPSSYGCNYEDGKGGYAKRDVSKIRIRAFRSDLKPLEY